MPKINVVMLGVLFSKPFGGPVKHIHCLASHLDKNEVELHLVTFGSETKRYGNNGLFDRAVMSAYMVFKIICTKCTKIKNTRR